MLFGSEQPRGLLFQDGLRRQPQGPNNPAKLGQVLKPVHQKYWRKMLENFLRGISGSRNFPKRSLKLIRHKVIVFLFIKRKG